MKPNTTSNKTINLCFSNNRQTNSADQESRYSSLSSGPTYPSTEHRTVGKRRRTIPTRTSGRRWTSSSTTTTTTGSGSATIVTFSTSKSVDSSPSIPTATTTVGTEIRSRLQQLRISAGTTSSRWELN